VINLNQEQRLNLIGTLCLLLSYWQPPASVACNSWIGSINAGNKKAAFPFSATLLKLVFPNSVGYYKWKRNALALFLHLGSMEDNVRLSQWVTIRRLGRHQRLTLTSVFEAKFSFFFFLMVGREKETTYWFICHWLGKSSPCVYVESSFGSNLEIICSKQILVFNFQHITHICEYLKLNNTCFGRYMEI
jgi:hypothetical protein